ncbi:hypothetical protein BBJ28_00023260, partial [Nothophytophthora sp. Chile5]
SLPKGRKHAGMEDQPTPKQVRSKKDEQNVNAINALANAAANRARALSLPERLDILVLQANLRLGKISLRSKQLVTNVIASLLCRSRETVGRLGQSSYRTALSRYQAHLPIAKARNNVPATINMQYDVREFIREHSSTRTRTVAKGIMQFMIERDYLAVNAEMPSDFDATLRATRRFLKRSGYKRGKRKGATYRLSAANEEKRDQYIQRMIRVEAEKRRIVYMDESYIHQNYARHDDSLYDPSDTNITKAKYKGRRLCFIAAIIAEDTSITDEERNGVYSAHLLKQTIDIFEGGSKPKTTTGYLTLIISFVILMDNAKYHITKPSSLPKRNTKKQALQAACDEFLLPYNAVDTKSILWARIASYIDTNVSPIVIDMARSRGHDVFFTPPYHSDLQPIELIWATVKGEIAAEVISQKAGDVKQDKLVCNKDVLLGSVFLDANYELSNY